MRIGSLVVEEALEELVAAAGHKSGWSAYRLYVDDPQSATPLGLTPADPGNAWQIKLRLADLDRSPGAPWRDDRSRPDRRGP